MRQKLLSVLALLTCVLTAALPLVSAGERPAPPEPCRFGANPVDLHREVDPEHEAVVVLDRWTEVTMLDGDGKEVTCLAPPGTEVVVDIDTGEALWFKLCGNPAVGRRLVFPGFMKPTARIVREEIPSRPCPKCGNGILENGEECDDGNVRDGDGCDAYCDLEGDAVSAEPFWFAAGSLLRLNGGSGHISWFESQAEQERVDPSINVEFDSAWGIGGGVGYQWRNRFSLMGQLLYTNEGQSVSWDERPHFTEVRDLTMSQDSSRWGIVVTGTIPFDALWSRSKKNRSGN